MSRLVECGHPFPRNQRGLGGYCLDCRKIARRGYRKAGKDKYRRYHVRGEAKRDLLKLEIMTHYGPSGQLCCSHPGCQITDIDMLTLDHINNNGAQERRERNSVQTWRDLRKNGYPTGEYQTLCSNHNIKKEIIRRRGLRGQNTV